MENVNSHLASYLKMLRGEKSLYQVGKELGFSRSLLRRYEMGERVPEDETLQKLANYYGVTFSELKFRHFEDLFPETSAKRKVLLEWIRYIEAGVDS